MGSWKGSSALVIALLAAASGSCQEPIATEFSIRFALDPTAGSLCDETDCRQYTMSCGARLSVRIFDTEGTNSERGTLVGETCEAVKSSEKICDLRNTSQLGIVNVPLHHVRIEVAAWHPADVPENACPPVTFDAVGRPRVDFQPRPAVAGAKAFDVSSNKVEVWIPLQCTDIARLDDVECRPEITTLLRARIDDLAIGFAVSEAQAEGLNVSAAPPTPVDGSPTAQRIDVDDFIGLSRVVDGPPSPTFERDFVGRMSGHLCTVVLDSGPQVTATATCTEVDMDQASIDLRGILVTTGTLQPLLDAMGSAFPEAGLVVGRVLDRAGTPLAGVRVIPDAGTVEYLDEAGTGFTGTTTGSRGYFISRDAPFGTTWRATHPDGRVEQSVQVAGLVNQMVSPVILRMVDPDAPDPTDDGSDDDGDDLGDTVPP